MADYDWFDYKGPTEAEKEAGVWQKQGLDAVYRDYKHTEILYYRCRRGCGTLVWSPVTHVANVCINHEG